MHRIDTDGAVANEFSEGDPLVPRNPTQVDKHWLNAVQEELANAIENAGITLAKGTWTQLRTAMANLTTAQSFTAVKTFARGLIASKLAGALGTTVVITGAAGAAAGDNGGVGGEGLQVTGGAGDTAENGGRAASFTGGVGAPGETSGDGLKVTGGASGGSAGPAGAGLEAIGGAEDGGGYADAVKATHGDIHAYDGNVWASRGLIAVTAGESAVPAEAKTLVPNGSKSNSWVDVDAANDAPCAYWKDASNVVHLEGFIKDGVGLKVFTLPSGYRPTRARYSAVMCSGGTDLCMGYCSVAINGDVSVVLGTSPGTTTASLDGITFRAD